MAGPGGVPYVEYTDLPNYFPASAINLATVPQQQQACIDATTEMDARIRGRFQMPLLAWGTDLRRMTGYIAIYILMAGPIGWGATGGNPDANITGNYDRAIKWADGVQRQAIQPDVTPSITVGADPVHDAPQVSSQQMRGWQQTNRRGKPVVGGF